MSLYTRRQFTKLALSALPAAGLLPGVIAHAAAAAGKVNSKVKGVQIGLNVPYSFGSVVMDGDEIVSRCQQLGVNGLELRTQPVELFLGAPKELLGRPGRGDTTVATRLQEWRKGADPKRAAEFRKKYEAAGMLIEIVKVDNLYALSDAELDYVFTLAKTLGARALSAEIATLTDDAKREADHARIGSFADKHQLMVGIHGHEKVTPELWEKVISHGNHMGINLDLGHFIAGNNYSPVEYLKKRHDKVTHIHVKDRTKNMGENVAFGTGDTPIAEVLRLMRDNKWKFQATIEFEIKVPEATRMAEIAKSIQYCRDALA
jgi:sugar phosphate isomerase/epimerase